MNITPQQARELAGRVSQLSRAVTEGPEGWHREFTMRVPAEPDRDADIVLSRAAAELTELAGRVEAQEDALAGMAGEVERQGLTVTADSDVRQWFDAWNRHTDFALSASEEWGEAIVAVYHYKRNRIDAGTMLDELADAIIVATHVAHTAGVIGLLNERIATKIAKGMAKVAALEGSENG